MKGMPARWGMLFVRLPRRPGVLGDGEENGLAGDDVGDMDDGEDR